MNRHDELPLFVIWKEFLMWLLQHTEKFPKRVRFTISSRMDNLALDILENIIEARYSHEKLAILKTINLQIEKLRILVRISHELKYLPHKSYEHACRYMNEAGKMTGGWIKQQSK